VAKQRAHGRATIGDVAGLAGVSKATVSRVLNSSRTVAPEKAQAVHDAVVKLRYEPFGPAKALRQSRVRIWAVIIADIQNPFFTSVVRGIEDIAHVNGYRLVLCNSDEDVEKEASYLDIAIRERMSGVVIAAASTTSTHIDRLLDDGIPVVAIDRRLDDAKVDAVVVDNTAGACEATLHLIESGYRRIGCIVGPAEVSTSAERLAGYRTALRQAGHRYDKSIVRRADYREAGAYKATAALLEQDEPPDALFIANNLMTVGAIRAIHERGLSIPDDIGLVGFDDSPIAELLRPTVTVVAQPVLEIGRTAAELLLDAEPNRSARDVVLAPRLVVRESCRRVATPPRKRR
jgi:LacI family transcriptional regulator